MNLKLWMKRLILAVALVAMLFGTVFTPSQSTAPAPDPVGTSAEVTDRD